MRRQSGIRTERSLLRPFAAADAEDLLVLFRDEAVRRYLLDGAMVDRAWVDQEIRDSAVRFSEGSAGLWAIRLQGTEAIIGFVGFRPFFDPPELQLLYGLLPAYWGRGLATEAARAVIQFGFDVAGFDRVVAATDTPNQASVRVMEALGMDLVGRQDEGAFGGTVTCQLVRTTGGIARRE